MTDEFLDELAEFIEHTLEPLDSAERVAAIDRVAATLSKMRVLASGNAAANVPLESECLTRWEDEGGAIPPDGLEIECGSRA